MKLFKKDHYEKMFAERSKTVGDYLLQIARAQDKIRELQALCKHTDFKVVFYSYRPGSMVPSRVCDSCHFRISDATEEEARLLQESRYIKD